MKDLKLCLFLLFVGFITLWPMWVAILGRWQ